MINGERRRHGGFSYLILLFFLAIMGIVLAVQASIYSFDRQRQKENDLLRAGRDMQRALQSYYKNPPGGMPNSYPPSLDELLEDSRWTPLIKRHLRRIPLDPMTGTYDWGLKQQDSGQIIGVFSTSEKTPIKSANFEDSEKDFASASSYQGWEFIGSALEAAAGGTASGAVASAATGGQPNSGAPNMGTPGNGGNGTIPGSNVPIGGNNNPGGGNNNAPGQGGPHNR